jgi:hypothetical protein
LPGVKARFNYGGHMETKVIFGVQQCYDMKASERINYPDFAISWGFETKEDAIKAIQKTLDYNNTNIYFKIFKKTITIEIIGNIK